MEPMTRSQEGSSIVGLVTGLREDFRTLFREELQLAKTEVSEKVALLRRNVVFLAIGGVVALLAAAILLASLSFAAAFGFESLGFSTGMALFLGFLVVAVIAGLIGGVFIGKAMSAFKKETLVPEKTIETLKEIKQGGLEQVYVRTEARSTEPKDTRSSEEIRSDVEETRSRIGREVRGLKTRLGLARMASDVVMQVRNKPVLSVGIGVGTGVAGFVLMRIARLFGRRRAV